MRAECKEKASRTWMENRLLSGSSTDAQYTWEHVCLSLQRAPREAGIHHIKCNL